MKKNESDRKKSFEEAVFSADDDNLELKNNIVDQFEGFYSEDFEEQEEVKHKSIMKDFFVTSFPGIIITFLFHLAKKISKLSRNGFFGTFFTLLYSKIDEKKSSGLLDRLFLFIKNGKNRKVRFRTRIAHLYETSLTSRIIEDIKSSMINSKVKTIGAFFMSFGSAIETLFLINHFVLHTEESSLFLWVGIGLILFSIPPLASDKKIGDAVADGKISSYIFVNALGFEESSFKTDDEKQSNTTLIFVLLGIGLGLAFYFVDSQIFIRIILVVLCGIFVLSTPELGILIICGLVPITSLLSSSILVLFVFSLLVACSFFFKWCIGKRIVKLGALDIIVLIFLSFMFFGGVSGVGGQKSMISALIYTSFALLYFFIVNMFKKLRRVLRSIRFMIVSTSLAALAVIVVYVSQMLKTSLTTEAFFNSLNEPLFLIFNDINVLSFIVVMVLPFAIGQIFAEVTKNAKIFYTCCSFVLLICAILSNSNMVMIGVLAAIVFYFILYDARSIWVFLGIIITIPLISLLIPNSVISQTLVKSVISESSISYTLTTWKGVLNIIKEYLITGIGVGESAFCDIYPMYAYSGAMQSTNAHNVWLGITVSCGIFALLIFVLLVILFLQKSFEHLRYCDDRPRTRIIISSGISSIIGILFSGFGNDIFSNQRIFLVFFLIMGLVSATISIDRSRLLRESTMFLEDEKNASIDIDVEI